MELISIIVPIYNAENYLEGCIMSILMQSYENIEVILIDDGSTDESLKICKINCLRDDRIRVLEQKNSGVSSARNAGINDAKGEWISFIDADDYIEQNYIQELINVVLPDTDIVISGVREIHRNKVNICAHNIVGEKVYLTNDNKDELVASIFSNYGKSFNGINFQILGYVCGKLYRRKCIGDIRFELEIQIREDTIFNISVISKAKSVLITNYSSYNYVINANSATNTYRPNFTDEVVKHNKICRVLWIENKLPLNLYYIGVLYSYMMWLKLYVMHPNYTLKAREKKNIIRLSFAENVWKEAFYNVNKMELTVPYRVLKYFFKRKFVLGIVLLFKISRLIKER